MIPRVEIKVDFEPALRFAKSVTEDLRGVGDGPVADALYSWLNRYRKFLRERFDNNSRGSGDWPALAPSTIAAKLSRASPKRRSATGRFIASAHAVYILRDTETLFNALSAEPGGGPGWHESIVENGVEAGYDEGGAIHPSGLSIYEIAKFAEDGSSNRPQRIIVVEPDDDTQNLMLMDMSVGLERAAQEAGAS